MLTSLSLAVALALGVGAVDSNSITVMLDGKPTRITLAGVAAGDARAAEFSQCLVAGRVLRISGPHSAAHVTLLDDTAVAAHIGEFVQTRTTSDPCTLGVAAYQPKQVHATAASANAPLPAVKKKAVREVHVSFSEGGDSAKNGLKLPPSLPAPTRPYVPPAQAGASRPTEPAYQGQTPITVQTYTPPTVGASVGMTVTTTTVGSAGTQQLPQQGTEQLPQKPPETLPTSPNKPPV
jgi:hypothetical protein